MRRHCMNADPLREISEEDVRRYEEDGVVLLKGMFDEAWRKHLSEQIEVDIANPGPLHAELEGGGQPGRFFFDTFMWTYNAAFKQFVFESPAVRIAARMMRANKVNIFYDQLLIKEPGTVKRTPWHHDMPYWPLVGWQVCTIWLALDPVAKESGAVEYVRASHKWGIQFNPTAFAGDDRYEQGMPQMPDLEAMRHSLQLIQYELEPGDCTVHHALLVHAAPGNTLATRRRRAVVTRWTGDDVRYAPKPKIQPLIRQPTIAAGAPLDSDLWPVVWSSPRHPSP
ncbi:MAG: phytanoyl-CoA dioxygenase [Candidatus Rokuibacteriota bacterium]|nr:MAG: phytanoyl-CoA dioxygenase [Candidatus Rokubacteria bacterium]